VRRKLDRLDLALLNLLQADGRATCDELAAVVPLSPSTIARRLRRLRRDGVIVATYAVVAPETARGRLSAVVQVQLDSHAPSGSYSRLRRSLLDSSEVQLLLEISGTFDLLLLVATGGVDEFNQFADTKLGGDPAVRRYETSFVKKQLKLAPIVHLDERDLE
jgi:Lrp/AsnC family transcriptional regulator, leucine-responsive regulatory protein